MRALSFSRGKKKLTLDLRNAGLDHAQAELLV